MMTPRYRASSCQQEASSSYFDFVLERAFSIGNTSQQFGQGAYWQKITLKTLLYLKRGEKLFNNRLKDFEVVSMENALPKIQFTAL